MRISTSAIYDANVSMLNMQQAKLLHTQQQLASGKRILTPSDDPASAALALDVTQADSMNTQYTTNRYAVQHTASLSESILQSVTALLQDVKTITVQAGAGSLTLSDKDSLATQLSSRLAELQALANTTDGNGNYLYSGFQGRTQPFSNSASGVQYMADDGQRMVRVSSSRTLAASDSGADIFMRIKSGNGTFAISQATAPLTLSTNAAIAADGVTVTLPSPANTSTLVVGAPITGGGFPAGTTVLSITNATDFVTSASSLSALPVASAVLQTGTGNAGSGIVSQGVVVNPAAITGHNYQLTFGVAAGVTTYSVTDATTGAVILPVGTPYVSGQAINFDGMQFDVSGAPANGDAFTIAPSQNESIFKTISDLITAMGTSGTSFSNDINTGLNKLDRDLDNVLTVRATLGSRLNEVDALQSTGDDLSVQFKSKLSQLMDMDYNKGISDLNQQKLGLEAAQMSFKQVSDLSLFNYL